MSEFEPITSQEQFDAAIKERLKRDRESQAKKYEGWTSPEDLQKQLADLNAKIAALEDAATVSEKALAEKDAEIAKGAKYRDDLEKTRIAIASGLKVEYADRLRGDNAEEWKADAETLAKDFSAAHAVAPLGSNEPLITKKADTATMFADWMQSQLN